jgi:hypothetical protein
MTLTKQQLQTEKKTITLKNTDELFKGTSFASEEFSITIKQLDRSDAINVMINSSDISGDAEDFKITTNSGNASKEKFISSVVSWEGFKDEEGSDIPCTHEMKEAIWNGEGLDILVAAVQSKIYEFDKKEIKEAKKKKAIKGNS